MNSFKIRTLLRYGKFSKELKSWFDQINNLRKEFPIGQIIYATSIPGQKLPKTYNARCLDYCETDDTIDLIAKMIETAEQSGEVLEQFGYD